MRLFLFHITFIADTLKGLRYSHLNTAEAKTLLLPVETVQQRV
jgi:hypothetical protein